VLTLFIISTAVGYSLFRLLLAIVPYLERKDFSSQKHEVLIEAKHQKDIILKGASEQITERLNIMHEELDTFLAQKQDDLTMEDVQITERETLLNIEKNRLHQIEEAQKKQLAALQEKELSLKEKTLEAETSRLKLISDLQHLAQTDAFELKRNLSLNYVNEKQIELQKVNKFLFEELNSSGIKLARRVLDRVHARYTPEFVWPKTSNILEVKEKKLLPLILNENSTFLNELQERSGVKIIPHQPTENLLFLKVVGGFGISREAVKLTLEKLVGLEAQHWSKAMSLFSNHSLRLEKDAVKLGKTATEILAIKGIHPEIQKLIGALNWRTSYRQNQWYHTVEVAQIAGILAHELGVDPDDAKRVGLLHDIGKAIDYRIDGSHAVISGDYADRFGEKRYICDTVMSHHADLIVESPLAYVLQAADTLSGARPGARVNLEEGYQVRLTAIHDVVKSFPGIQDLAVMHGGREVHIQVHNEQVTEFEVKKLTEAIARKIEQEVAYPGQIKILVTRIYESSAVA
jgi:ribonuclease Y